MAVIHPIDTIGSDPDVRGGQPIVAGTNIAVTDLVGSHLYRGLTADELAVNFNLTLGAVYAALAYYYQHKAEIDVLLRNHAEQADHWRQQLQAQAKLINLE